MRVKYKDDTCPVLAGTQGHMTWSQHWPESPVGFWERVWVRLPSMAGQLSVWLGEQKLKLRSDYRPSPLLPMTAWVEEAPGLVRVVVPLEEETALSERRKEGNWFPAGYT